MSTTTDPPGGRPSDPKDLAFEVVPERPSIAPRRAIRTLPIRGAISGALGCGSVFLFQNIADRVPPAYTVTVHPFMYNAILALTFLITSSIAFRWLKS